MILLATVECEKGTKTRYEMSKDGIVFKSKIKHRWVEAYGYVSRTLQVDGDALDAYIIGKGLKQGQEVLVAPLCLAIVYDNGVRDDKLITGVIAGGRRVNLDKVDKQIKKILKAISKYKTENKVVNVIFDKDAIKIEVQKYFLYQKWYGEGVK